MNNCYLFRLLSLVVLLGTSFTLTFGQLTVDAPVSIAGPYNSGIAVFGPLYGFSGLVVPVVDDDGLTTACVPIANAAEVEGNVALIDRGVCGFAIKAQAAEDAGAIAVIICNNDQANPDAVIRMGGTDNCALTIPTISMSYNDCQTVRMETDVMVTLNSPEGSTIDSAIEIGEGTFTADGIFGIENLFTGATADLYYKYVASAQGVLNVNSCGSGIDTRLIVVQTSGACRTELLAGVVLVTFSDDDCDDGAGNIVASNANLIVNEGEEYYILWDNAHSSDGFEFTVSLSDLPTVNTTFNVIMDNETVSDDGVQMIWAYPGATSLDDVFVETMTDNGDGTWSATIALTTLDTIGYAFVNGNVLAGGVIEEVPEECGVDGGFGFNVRPYIEVNLVDAVGGTFCFSTCTSFCPDLGCATIPVVFENIDGYSTDTRVGPQSPIWTTWSGAEGGTEDGFVSTEQAFSPPNSVKIEGNNGPMDVLLLLGNQDEGHWDLRFKLYIPSTNIGYYNIQNDETAGQQWNLEVNFGAGGSGNIVGGPTFTYTQDAWIDVIHRIDLDNDKADLMIDGRAVHSWTYGPDWKIGALNFYPAAGAQLYYVDDIILRPVAPCPEGSIICDGFELYNQGNISAQSAFWAPWTAGNLPDDGAVTGELYYEGCNSLKISDEDPDDQLLLLGDRTTGNYILEWYMHIPDGSSGYYNIQKFQDTPGATGGFGLQVELAATGTAAVDAGGADAATFSFPFDEWFLVKHYIDLDNNWMTLEVNGEDVYSWPVNWQTFAQTGTKQLGSIDFFGNTGNLYYIDNVLFQQIPSVPGNLCGGAIDLNSQLGGGVGEVVSSGPYDNTNYTTTSNDPDFGWECFGEPDGLGGAPSLERTMWFTFVGDGATYFIEALECGEDPIDDSDTQIAIYSGACNNLVAVACSEDGDNATTGYYPASLEFETEEGVTYYMMVDGFGPDFPADGEFCVEFTQLTALASNVTFRVNATAITVAPEGILLSGSFNGWPGSGTPMEDQGDGVWALTLPLLPGDYEYKFQNGPDGWEEGMTGDCVTGDFGNRIITVGDEDLVLDIFCFESCDFPFPDGNCFVSVDEQTLRSGVSIFPNPFKDVVNVRFELATAAENLNIRVVNSIGQTVYSQRLGQIMAENVEINMKDLPAGAYMIQIIDGEAQVVKTVVKQ
jgi:hypothetical protein